VDSANVQSLLTALKKAEADRIRIEAEIAGFDKELARLNEESLTDFGVDASQLSTYIEGLDAELDALQKQVADILPSAEVF
jgi:septal ring factor EnvC (AmiA/AmiB activator)